MAHWTGWRYTALVSGLVGAIVLAMYPIAISPCLHPEKWQNVQKETRTRSIEDTQPSGLKVWSDPFDRKKD